ncbi:MAG: hypothetical protein DMF60_18445 [Acidobacteria bacterium]|nr:MAG: hypothetical protein DMF60_18445 [Acidobacteriota bacterium]
MKHVFIITERGDLMQSLERYFRFTSGVAVSARYAPSPSPDRQQWVPRAFTQIADWIEASINQNGNECNLRRSIAILDLCDVSLSSLDELNPVATISGCWSAVVAMLILAFPEVHWVLITPYRTIVSRIFDSAHIFRDSVSFKRILDLYDQGLTTLFDPTNLRNMIRYQIGATGEYSGPEYGRRVDEYIPLRKEIAAAIDEEETYAYFNAYATYRFGFRSHVVTSQALMEELFKSKDEGASGASDFSIVFEDLYLRFPDTDIRKLAQDGEVHLSNLVTRDKLFPELAKTRNRILVTVGHRRSGDPDSWRQNENYLRGLKQQGKWNKVLYKPSSGIFDLWDRSDLLRKLGHGGYKGKPEGYKWPPEKPGPEVPSGGHSAPGRLLVIAKCLIGRSEKILEQAQSVPEAVHGAVLALEAQEYLGNRTPTTSLEALALKHQLEVLAECLFYGVEYNMNVRSRFEEIEKEVKSIGEWFRPKTRKVSMLNAEVRIVSELALQFREHNQFDEEQECLARIRELYRHL